MTTDEFYKNIYNKLCKMETHIIWKKESMLSPGNFNSHNLCCFVGCWDPVDPIALMAHGIVSISFDTVTEEEYLVLIH